MRALAVTRKDLLQIFRDRRAVVFLLLMPLAFTLFFGLAFSGLGEGGGDVRLQIGIVDDDRGALAGSLVQALGASEAIRPEALDELRRAYAGELVRRGDEAAVLTIPPGWGAALRAGTPRPLELVADTSTAAGLAAQRAVQATVDRFLDAERTAATAATLLAPRTQLSQGTLHDRALDLALAAWEDPPVRVANVPAGADGAAGAAAGAGAGPTGGAGGAEAFGANPYDQASPGMIVQFAVYGLLLSAMVLVIERKQGAHARLLGTPVPRAAVVAGHGLAMLGVVLAQIVVLEAFGQVALGVHYLRHPWATLALTLALALWSAGLGMLIGAFARTEQQVVASGLLAMFLFSGLGGAWFPLEITGPTFTAVGHLTPTAWAMDAYRAILLRGGGLREVALPLAVLVGCAVVFYVLAVVRLARRPS